MRMQFPGDPAMNALQALPTAALSSVRRGGFRWLMGATLAVTFACSFGPANAGEIPLSQFTGQETVINMNEIPGGGAQGSLGTPADNWSRTVYGVKFDGGKELWIGGRTSAGDAGNPFRSPPLSGDPNGFARASFGSHLGMYLPFGFDLDFSNLGELPRRVGINVSATGQLGSGSLTQAILRANFVYTDGSSTEYFLNTPVLRLLAVENSVPISRLQFSWASSFTGDGPYMEIDDIRFEPVPEPSTCGLAAAGLALAAFACSRRKVAAG